MVWSDSCCRGHARYRQINFRIVSVHSTAYIAKHNFPFDIGSAMSWLLKSTTVIAFTGRGNKFSWNINSEKKCSRKLDPGLTYHTEEVFQTTQCSDLPYRGGDPDHTVLWLTIQRRWSRPHSALTYHTEEVILTTQCSDLPHWGGDPDHTVLWLTTQRRCSRPHSALTYHTEEVIQTTQCSDLPHWGGDPDHTVLSWHVLSRSPDFRWCVTLHV